MIARADLAHRRDPWSPAAVRVARDAVEAARGLVAADVPGARLRLADALAQLAASGSADAVSTQEMVLRCWTVCRSLLDDPDPSLDRDAVVARLAYLLGSVFPMLSMTERQQEAAEMMHRVSAAARDAAGPHGAHAAARVGMHSFAAAAHHLSADPRTDLGITLHQLLANAARTLSVLESHSRDGVHEAGEYAQALEVVSRLLTLNGNRDLAAEALDTAIAVASSIADQGPVFRRMADQLRAQRAGLPEA
ncbi:hypothetical protein [Catenuloplanes indicus]|uniref:Uncharacterized protein n=1 Tax=Catenuloplanes indicus TaxID=137267 RepID=A0AAE3VVN9_9ACTN|nr:hypothetical protein [Catenuloplanes indicus]MDQ0364601.1 hypothetical protein [Catenuloplanes indicus]